MPATKGESAAQLDLFETGEPLTEVHQPAATSLQPRPRRAVTDIHVALAGDGQATIDALRGVERGPALVRQWEAFLAGNFAWARFTKLVYHTLTLECGFIAHFNRAGFYGVYFDGHADDARRFITQFVTGDHAELGGTWWLDRPDSIGLFRCYAPKAMCAIMRRHAHRLRGIVDTMERSRDLALVQSLAAKHGIAIVR